MENNYPAGRHSANRTARLLPWLLLIIVLLLVGMGWAVYLYMGQVNQNRFMIAESKHRDGKQKGLENLISQVKDSLGVERTKVFTLTGTQEQFASIINMQKQMQEGQLSMQKELDWFGIKLKDMQNSPNLKVETNGEYFTISRDSIVRVPKHDTIRDTVEIERKIFKVLEFGNDQWFTAKVVINGDSGSIRPKVVNEFKVMSYNEKRKKKAWWDFFPGKQTVSEIHVLNPYSTVKEFRVINKEKKKKFLGIF